MVFMVIMVIMIIMVIIVIRPRTTIFTIVKSMFLGGEMDGWVDGCVGGWLMDVKAILKIVGGCD
jgi:hypothetical protein